MALVSNVSLLVAMVFVYDLVNGHLLRLDTVLPRVMVGLATTQRATRHHGVTRGPRAESAGERRSTARFQTSTRQF